LQILTTEATNYAESLGLSKFDNPLIIINDLKDKMKLTLNYETPNLEEPNK
jgi:hypothetical protein